MLKRKRRQCGYSHNWRSPGQPMPWRWTGQGKQPINRLTDLPTLHHPPWSTPSTKTFSLHSLVRSAMALLAPIRINSLYSSLSEKSYAASTERVSHKGQLNSVKFMAWITVWSLAIYQQQKREMWVSDLCIKYFILPMNLLDWTILLYHWTQYCLDGTVLVAYVTSPDLSLWEFLLRDTVTGIWWCDKACFIWEILTKPVPGPGGQREGYRVG